MQAHVAGRGALGDYFVALLGGVIKMGDTPTVSRLLRGAPEDPTQPSWGGRYVRAWQRPFVTFERLTTAADRIEHFAILELVLPLGDGAPPHPEARLVVENQSLIGHVDAAGRMRFRFSPKEAKTYTYTIRSNVPSLEGRTGAITAVDPAPDAATQPAADLPHWWTDDPAPAAAEGVHHGAAHGEPMAAGLPGRLRGAPGARADAAPRPADRAGRAIRSATSPAHVRGLGDQLEGSQARGEVVDVGHDDQLVGAASARPARRGRGARSRRCRRRCTPASATRWAFSCGGQ